MMLYRAKCYFIFPVGGFVFEARISCFYRKISAGDSANALTQQQSEPVRMRVARNMIKVNVITEQTRVSTQSQDVFAPPPYTLTGTYPKTCANVFSSMSMPLD